MDPIWIGAIGTGLALVIIVSALRTIRKSGNKRGGGRGLMMIYLIMALMFIGVIWFIILRLMPGV